MDTIHRKEMEMVNCNNTIHIPDINVTDRAASVENQAKQPVSWYAAITGLMVSLVEYLARLQARSRDRQMLQKLDDRLLKDIGVTRADVERELAKPFLSGFPRRG
jgi:uncharacterized protein YjiS (DUF1127 family)